VVATSFATVVTVLAQLGKAGNARGSGRALVWREICLRFELAALGASDWPFLSQGLHPVHGLAASRIGRRRSVADAAQLPPLRIADWTLTFAAQSTAAHSNGANQITIDLAAVGQDA